MLISGPPPTVSGSFYFLDEAGLDSTCALQKLFVFMPVMRIGYQ